MKKPFLIVGLGNPGVRYAETRHNAGFWFLDRVAGLAQIGLRAQSRLQADVARTRLHGHDCLLARPRTFMNHSGQAVRALVDFYKIAPDHILVAYDEKRGEPRGGRKRGVDPAAVGLGSCVDCNMCVQVCPTGIDIRDGLQIECIACAACIDVCDSVMDRMEYPRGLIRYTSDKALKEKRQLRILRPRVMIYGGLLLALFIGFVVSLGIRTPVRLDAIRDRNTLYREVAGGEIENVFSLKLLNLDTRSHRYEISVDGPEGLRLALDSEDLELESGEPPDGQEDAMIRFGLAKSMTMSTSPRS